MVRLKFNKIKGRPPTYYVEKKFPRKKTCIS